NANRPYAGRYNPQATRLANAFRLICRRVRKIPAITDPSAYDAATSEKLPAPRPSVSRTSVGTPTIQVPAEIVTPTPRTRTAAASIARGRSAAKPSRIRGAVGCSPAGRRARTPESRAAERKNEAALIAKKALIGIKASRP